MKRNCPIIILLLLVCISISNAQVLTFEFNGNNGTADPVASNFNDFALTASAISRGAGLIAVANNNSFNSSNWSTVSIADAVANDNYVEFTVTPNAGFQFDVNTITFQVRRNNNGFTSIALRSSLDGFTTDIDAVVPITANYQVVTFNVNQLNNTGSVTYRLYGTANTADGQGRFENGGANNDIVVDGSINTSPAVSCNISDDFESPTLGAEWTDIGGNATTDPNLTIVSNSVTALDYVYQDVSSVYNTTLSALANTITWNFNMRQSRGNPNGFNSGQDGVAFVLGATESDLTVADGYAVVLGENGGTDNVRLVSFTDGIDANANLTDIITGSDDYGNEYSSIRVTYEPATDNWELFVRNDGVVFSSPLSLDASHSQGNLVNTTYVDVPLNFIANVFNHSNNANRTAFFDNICIATDLTCSSTVTWNGTGWSPSAPNNSTTAVINGNYNTSSSGSFVACSLEVNANLVIGNGDFIEIINDVTVNNGSISTETRGSFVQRGSGALAGSFVLSGTGASEVIKTTADLANWYSYTYWSSPVVGETTDSALSDADVDRRFWFNAGNFLDTNGDGIDDNADAWTRETGSYPMTPGQGFAATHNEIGYLGVRGYDYTFEGSYNTGDITYGVIHDVANPIEHWNLIGNPYPSAINVDLFFSANTGVVEEALYMWSQVSPLDGSNPGNEVLNFSQNDYITINSVGEAGNGTTGAPSRQVPSGQAFFIPSLATTNVTFTNSMRVSGNNANDEFYRAANNSTSNSEKLWLNLGSDIGVYSQVCVAYTNKATDGYDGNNIDTPRNFAGNAGYLFTLIDGQSTTPFVIQGKSPQALNTDESIKVGFATYISTIETYQISLPQIQGAFLNNNPIYLRDNDLGIVHNLKAEPYEFTSSQGFYDNRFELVFSNSVLSVDDNFIESQDLTIFEAENGLVNFSLSNSSLYIDTLALFDLQGRLVYDLNVDASSKSFDLSKLKSSVFIAKATLSNGTVITKKSIKR